MLRVHEGAFIGDEEFLILYDLNVTDQKNLNLLCWDYEQFDQNIVYAIVSTKPLPNSLKLTHSLKNYVVSQQVNTYLFSFF